MGWLETLNLLLKAYISYNNTIRVRELRELRNEQKQLRNEIIIASRPPANSSLLDELQNQLNSSYSDGNALRNAESNTGK